MQKYITFIRKMHVNTYIVITLVSRPFLGYSLCQALP